MTTECYRVLGENVTVRPIRLIGDPALAEPAEIVRDFDKALRAVVKDLMRTLRDDPRRAGVAAPQIGVPLRVVAYSVDGRQGHIVNPVLELSERAQDGDEGCLSAPGLWVPVRRAYQATARGRDRQGRPVTVRALGTFARCLQHEADHLDGVLFLDRLEPEHRAEADRHIAAAGWAG